MRVLDMRLIVFVTLILLTAASPANCAGEPATRVGLLTRQGSAAQARDESWRQRNAGAGSVRRAVMRDRRTESGGYT